MAKKLVEFRNIVKNFDGQIVLKGVNLDIYENEFVTLLGPSGCGKTTLLRILGGFLDADEGQVIFDGEEISDKPPYERELNTVFQKYALFPHLSVYENIAFGLKIKKVGKDIIDQKVMKMLKLIGLEGYENKNTTLLSGGQQQRVAIARNIVTLTLAGIAHPTVITTHLGKQPYCVDIPPSAKSNGLVTTSNKCFGFFCTLEISIQILLPAHFLC